MAPRRTQSSPTRAGRLREATRQRRDQEKQELRETILDAAGRLFVQLGYERFSMRQLAEEIGYAPATIYLYFRDKDDLLFTIVQDGFEEFGRALRAADTSSGDPRERLLAQARAYLQFGIGHPMHYQLMFVHRPTFLMQIPPEAEEPRIATLLVLQQAVRAAMDAGVLRPGDVESTADAIWAWGHGVVILAIYVPFFDERRVEAAVEHMLEMLGDVLRQT